MRTAQERVCALHLRAQELQRRREKSVLTELGTACAMLFVCTAWLIFGMGSAHMGVLPGQYTGATMIFESAGGYVLVAVIAFTAGASIAAVLLRRRAKQNENNDKIDITTGSTGEGGTTI